MDSLQTDTQGSGSCSVTVMLRRFSDERANGENILATCSCTDSCVTIPQTEAKDSADVSGTTQAWWMQPRWQLLMTSYSLLGAGLCLQFLLHGGLPPIILFAGSIVAGAYPSAISAWISLRHFRLSIATLVIVAAFGAILLGLWEEAAELVAVYSLGGILETRAVGRARNAIQDVRALAPQTAVLNRNGVNEDVTVDIVVPGDLIRIRPGSLIPLDGVISEGNSTIDESSITGEPFPVEKGSGEKVFSGTMNGNGSLLVRVSSKAEDSTVAQIIKAVEDARNNRSSLETFAERFGAKYTSAMFFLALIVGVLPGMLGLPWSTWIYRALVLLVISCSCGLIMSVPVASIAAVTAGARRGIVIKGGASLESASDIDIVVLDKTGTLTVGRPQISLAFSAAGYSDEEVLAIAAGVETSSEHPLALALVEYAVQRNVTPCRATNFYAEPGKGASADLDGRRIWVGSLRWARESGITVKHTEGSSASNRSNVRLAVWDKHSIIGLFDVSDLLREDAKQAVSSLAGCGISSVMMMTGDTRNEADAVARELGDIEVMAELLPHEKANEIRRLQSEGHRVAFVGDGINDAPALVQADIGIAMGHHGTDIAQASCDVVLMRDNLRDLPAVFELSRRTMRTMSQNVTVSIAEVVILVALALTGVVGLVAGIALNEGSAIAVMLNGLKLNRS